MSLHTADEAAALGAVDALLGGWEAALCAHAVALGDWAAAERVSASACARAASTLRLRPAGGGRSPRVLPVGADVYVSGPRPEGDSGENPVRAELAGHAERSAAERYALAEHLQGRMLPVVATLRDDISARAQTLRASLSAAEGRLRRPHGASVGATARLVRVLRARAEKGNDAWHDMPDAFVHEQALVVATSNLLAARAQYASALGGAVRAAAALDRHAGATLAASLDDLCALLVRQSRGALHALGCGRESSGRPHCDAPDAGSVASARWSDGDVEALLARVEAAKPLDDAYRAALSAAHASAGASNARPTRIVRAGFLLRPAGAFGRSWAVVWAVLTDSGFLHLFEASALSPARVPGPEMNLHAAALGDLNAAALSTLAGVSSPPSAPGVSHVHAALLARPGTSVCVAAGSAGRAASSRGLEHAFAVDVPAGRGVFGRAARRHVLRAYVADDVSSWLAAIASVVSAGPGAAGAEVGGDQVFAGSDSGNSLPHVPLPAVPAGEGGESVLPLDRDHETMHSPFGDGPDLLFNASGALRSTPALPDDDDALSNPWGR